MIHFLHPKTMICPFELHPNTSEIGGAVAKECPDQKHAVAFALPFIPLLDSARRPRALALMRELRTESADPAVQFCSLTGDSEDLRAQHSAIETNRNRHAVSGSVLSRIGVRCPCRRMQPDPLVPVSTGRFDRGRFVSRFFLISSRNANCHRFILFSGSICVDCRKGRLL